MIISGEQLDAIRETINISAGQSATALSELLGCRVNMEVPEIRFIEINKLGEILSEETKSFISFFSNFEKNFNGNILVAYDKNQKERIVSIVMERYGVSVDEENILEEVSNIVFGAFVGGLSNFIGLNITFSPPKKVENLNDLRKISDSIVILGEVLLLPDVNGKIRAKILIIPTSESVSLLLDKLRGLIG